MEKFIEFVKMMIERPGMFCINKVEDISFICFGYIQSSNESLKISEFLHGYSHHLRNKYGLDLDWNLDWQMVIRLVCGASDKTTLDRFRETFSEYCDSI